MDKSKKLIILSSILLVSIVLFISSFYINENRQDFDGVATNVEIEQNSEENNEADNEYINTNEEKTVNTYEIEDKITDEKTLDISDSKVAINEEQLQNNDVQVDNNEENSNVENENDSTKEETQVDEDFEQIKTPVLEEDTITEEIIDLDNQTEVEKESKSVNLEIVVPDKTLLNNQEVMISEGDSVYDVLEKTLKDNGIPLYTRGNKNNIYIEGIDNYFEFDYGPSSGFVYYVDGVSPNISSSKYILNGSENILWVYEQ